MIRLRDGVASTKRTLADYSNCTLHGWLSSASSAKVRAMQDALLRARPNFLWHTDPSRPSAVDQILVDLCEAA